MEEENLFDLLEQKDNYDKLLYYVGNSEKIIGESVNYIIEQIYNKISQIIAKIFADS